MVVSVEEKSGVKPGMWESERRMNLNHCGCVERRKNDIEIGITILVQDKSVGDLIIVQMVSGVEVA